MQTILALAGQAGHRRGFARAEEAAKHDEAHERFSIYGRNGASVQ
jgi:hypothetical protein